MTLCCLAGLAACAPGSIHKEDSYPTRERGTDAIQYSDQPRTTIFGKGKDLTSALFSSGNKNASKSGIGVNSYLWRAALDTIAFMPVASADPFGGTILTDWYENPDQPGERFKVDIYILDRQLRADGVRVSVFKQKLVKNQWRNENVSPDMANNIENSILTRARTLRVTDMSLPQ
ncbi:MAG: DUF3576 domain-containing protein [Alphaproteobacteria bacterium]|nr:DUF3576 domain-containing protein [Alphaproteobacteria bacterium]MDE2336815.1 DUF3576 domain-containing protein [Alphaproteobacteria bacterium]